MKVIIGVGVLTVAIVTAILIIKEDGEIPSELKGKHDTKELPLDPLPKGLKIDLSKKDLINKVSSDFDKQKSFQVRQLENLKRIQKDITKIEDINPFIKKLEQAYAGSRDKFLENITEITNAFITVSEWKKKRGVGRSQIELIHPKTAFSLSLITGKSLDEIAKTGTQGLELTTKDLFSIRAFSLGKDFDILNSQDRLTTEELNLEKLNMVYDTSREVMVTPDGKVYGEPEKAIPPSEPIVEEPEIAD